MLGGRVGVCGCASWGITREYFGSGGGMSGGGVGLQGWSGRAFLFSLVLVVISINRNFMEHDAGDACDIRHRN